jgi:hypothetical protein
MASATTDPREALRADLGDDAPPPADATASAEAPVDIPLVAPGTKAEEAEALTVVERMTGAELVRLLKEEALDGVPLDRVKYGPRMKHRSLERLGELRYEPGIPYLIRDINYVYPSAGEPRPWSPYTLGRLLNKYPAPASLIQFGKRALPQVRDALAREKDDDRWLSLDYTVRRLSELPDQ